MEMTKSSQKERIYLFDNIKAILIFLVVIGHMINILYKFQNIENEFISTIWHTIYLFHMPAFMFVSGFFSKKEQSFRKILSSLLFPYLIFNIVFYIMHFNFTFPFLPDSAMWFLFSLSVYKILLPYFKNIKHILFISAFLAMIYDVISIPELENSIGQTIKFFPFFLAGYYMTFDQVKKIRTKKIRMYTILLTILLLISFIAVSCVVLNYTDEMLYAKSNRISYDMHGLSVWVMRILSGVFGFLITIALISLMPNKKFRITSIGQRTLIIYLLHYLPIFQWIIKKIPISNNNVVAIIELLLLSTFICIALSRNVIVGIYNYFFTKIEKIFLLEKVEKND